MERKKRIDVLIDLILPEFLIFLQKYEEEAVYISDDDENKTNKNSKLVKIILPEK